MEKRFILALALSFAILLGWNYLFPPPERPAPAVARPQEEVATPGPAPEAAEVEIEERADAPPAAEAPAVGAEAVATVEVDNGVLLVQLTNRGGRARSWRLIEYTTPDGSPLELLPAFEANPQRPLGIDLDDPVLAEQINEALYEVRRELLPADERHAGGAERVTFRWSDGRGLEVHKSFTFRPGDYLVDVELEVRDRGRRLPARLKLGPGFEAQESADGRSSYYYDGQGVWNLGGEVTRQRKKKLREAGGFSGRVLWAGLEDQYFAALVLPQQAESVVRWRSVELMPAADGERPGEEEAREAGDEPILSVGVPPRGGQLFIGPKNYKLLREMGYELEESIWFSSQAWLRPVVKYIFLCLVWIHDHVANNYGLAIVLATLLLRLLLFPVNQYSMVSMKKQQLQMQRLQPKIKAIRNKYRKSKDSQSRSKMNQETMELYRREGVNPMGGLSGCLPLLAQFPILIGFYNMLTVAIELRGAPFFGWIQDLSREDPYWITPLLMGVTMFAQQKMAMSKIKDPQQLQQQRMMLFMPVMFTFICLGMPSGLVLYWFMNNLMGMGQQWLVNRHTGRLEAAVKKKAAKKA